MGHKAPISSVHHHWIISTLSGGKSTKYTVIHLFFLLFHIHRSAFIWNLDWLVFHLLSVTRMEVSHEIKIPYRIWGALIHTFARKTKLPTLNFLPLLYSTNLLKIAAFGRPFCGLTGFRSVEILQEVGQRIVGKREWERGLKWRFFDRTR